MYMWKNDVRRTDLYQVVDARSYCYFTIATKCHTDKLYAISLSILDLLLCNFNKNEEQTN